MTSSLPRDIVRACVVAGDVDTHYYRVGHGEPVLVLVGDTAVLSALLARLPRHLRTLAPNPHALEANGGWPSGDFGTWLRGFLDALGLQRVAIVADAAFASAALGFSFAEPERVTRLVLLRFGTDDEIHAVGGIPDTLSSETSLLTVSVADATGVDRAVSRIVDFVGGRAPRNN